MRVELKTLFRKLKATVVYVTHDQVEAMSLSDKIAVIDRGSIRQFGTPEELYEKPADLFVANFMGSPRINIFHVRIEGRNLAYGSERWRIPDKYLGIVKDKKDIILGVRAEDITIHEKGEKRGFRVELIMPEKLGNILILNLRWQGQTLRVSSTKKEIVDIAGDLRIEFNRDKLLLFDPLTERILGS